MEPADTVATQSTKEESCPIKEEQISELDDSGVFSNFDISPNHPTFGAKMDGVDREHEDDEGSGMVKKETGSKDENSMAEPADIIKNCFVFKYFLESSPVVEAEVTQPDDKQMDLEGAAVEGSTSQAEDSSHIQSELPKMQISMEDPEILVASEEQETDEGPNSGSEFLEGMEILAPGTEESFKEGCASRSEGGDLVELYSNKLVEESLPDGKIGIIDEVQDSCCSEEGSDTYHDTHSHVISDDDEITPVPTPPSDGPMMTPNEEKDKASDESDVGNFLASALANIFLENKDAFDLCAGGSENVEQDQDTLESEGFENLNGALKPQYSAGNVKVDFNTTKENGNEKFHLIVTFSDGDGPETSSSATDGDPGPDADSGRIISEIIEGLQDPVTVAGDAGTPDPGAAPKPGKEDIPDGHPDAAATKKESEEKSSPETDGTRMSPIPRRRRRKSKRFRKFAINRRVPMPKTAGDNSDESGRPSEQTLPSENPRNASREGRRSVSFAHPRFAPKPQRRVGTIVNFGKKRKLAGELEESSPDKSESSSANQERNSGRFQDGEAATLPIEYADKQLNRRFPRRQYRKFVGNSSASFRNQRTQFHPSRSSKSTTTDEDDNHNSGAVGGVKADRENPPDEDGCDDNEEEGEDGKKNPFQGLEERRERMRKNVEDRSTRENYHLPPPTWRPVRRENRARYQQETGDGGASGGSTGRSSFWNARRPAYWRRSTNSTRYNYHRKNAARVQDRMDGELSDNAVKKSVVYVCDASVQVKAEDQGDGQKLTSSSVGTGTSDLKINDFFPTPKAAASYVPGEDKVDIGADGLVASGGGGGGGVTSLSQYHSDANSGDGDKASMDGLQVSDGVSCLPPPSTSTQLVNRSTFIPYTPPRPTIATFAAPTPALLSPACRLPIPHASSNVSLPLRYMLMGAAALHSYYGSTNPAATVEPYYYAGTNTRNHCACCSLKQSQYNFV